MVLKYLPFIVFLLAALPAHADPGPMSAAGRIESTETEGTCSASLVAPDLVVTAAHCALDPEDLSFRPGDRIGLPLFKVAQVLRHPLYDPENDPTLWKFRFDIALLRLETPVPGDIARPFQTGGPAALDEHLFLVSWKNTRLPRQRKCRVIPGFRGLVTLGCAVIGGESGAPVIRMTAEGPELVAVLSSRSIQGTQPVAQGSDVELRLPPLFRLID